MELFLRQETAREVQKAIEKISTDQSYFDLGLTSLGVIHIIQKTNLLLDENLHPNALFEYRDIQSLAAYLVKAYPFKVAAVIATRNNAKGDESAAQRRITPATLAPLPRSGLFSNRAAPSFHVQTTPSPPEPYVS